MMCSNPHSMLFCMHLYCVQFWYSHAIINSDSLVVEICVHYRPRQHHTRDIQQQCCMCWMSKCHNIHNNYCKCLMMIMLILVATIHFRLIVDPGIGLGKHLDDTDVRQTSTLQVALTLVTLVTLALISKCYPCSSRRLWHSFLWNRTMYQAKKYITDIRTFVKQDQKIRITFSP